ncbi:MAG: DEAD/DEAH box helicase [Candidatus Woesearchaeota archaeon]|jgi:helicase|nr:hypothetical protein [Gammaproteobacteria bacterium]MDP7180354.1 DEAD/DEAH box helicase [Candidatus Woesearchaeota archaeon]
MDINELKSHKVPDFVIKKFQEQNISKLNPGQIKAIQHGLLDNKNLLVCTPTGSGKTAIATLAITKRLEETKGKAVYLVPMKALANEKYNDYKNLLKDTNYQVAISTGDIDSGSEWLSNYDLLILTVEKMDSLLRHKTSWISSITTVIIDEVHLLNDPKRGPTLEILLTLLKQLLKNVQLIALSATIGNPEELAKWLDANLVIDSWRPVKLHKGIYLNGEIEFS